MAYIYNKDAGTIADSEDGQLIATMSDSATPEQGLALVNAYNLLNAPIKIVLHHPEMGTLKSCVLSGLPALDPSLPPDAESPAP